MHTVEVGDIVSLQSHPFPGLSIDITISGEPNSIPPLMIVFEVSRIGKGSFNVNDGTVVNEKDSSNCKCYWFSNRTNQFVESSFYSGQLRIVEKRSERSQADRDKYPSAFLGKTVYFNTLPLELAKRKSSITSEDSTSEQRSKTFVTPFLNFVSPLLHVMEVKTNEVKEPKYDAKTGVQTRFFSKYSLKCKWYNSSTDKFSEVILPVELLTLIREIPLAVLASIDNVISERKTILYRSHLIQPKRLIFAHGIYSMTAFNLVTRELAEYQVDGTDINIVEPYLKRAPQLAFTGKVWKLETDILAIIKESSQKKLFLNIKYLDDRGALTRRTLSDLQLVEVPINKEQPTNYLIAYCNLRNAIRHFKVVSIQTVEQLNLKYQ